MSIDSAPPDRQGVMLGFDFGTARIGVAIADTVVRSARPLTAIAAQDNAARFAAIARCIEEWRPLCLVVGLPRSEDGGEHEMTLRARRFARQLHGRFQLPVLLEDERYSSIAAEEDLRAAGQRITVANKGMVDAQAAAVILQAWLDRPQADRSREA